MPAAEGQALLGRLLGTGSTVIFGVLVVAFAAYLTGVVLPKIPIEHLPHYWTVDAATLRRLVPLPDGWGWLRLVAYGDFMNLVAIAALASLMVGAYLVILVAYTRRRDWVYAAIALVQIVVLLLAASGLVAGH